MDFAASAEICAEIRKPLSKMRRAIGLNLQQSKQTVPHFYVRTTIDADPLLAFYGDQKAATNCTLNDVIVLAVGRTIRDFPAVRSKIIGNEIVEYPHANIGIAVGVEEGLVVPVVTEVDTRSLARLAAETKRVVDQARQGRLENIGQGHFTISNLGMYGVEEFSAIINPPESGILAVSAAREAVIVENGAMRAGRSMTMTLSADHRIVDGVMAAKFMQRLKAILEHPAGELA
jgi:pyruvate dehydrogenase E2 component (dihydrolipoamide acetyltransferase)